MSVQTIEETQGTNAVDPLAQLMKTRFMDYELKFDYEGFDKKKLTLMRWPYELSSEVLPLCLEMVGSVLSNFVAGDGAVDIFAVLSDPANTTVYKKHLDTLGVIIAKTLLLKKTNGFKTFTESYDLVKQMETHDVIEIAKILYVQNLEHLVKNVVPSSLTQKVSAATTTIQK